MSLESGTVVSVSTRTSGSQLAGDHAAGSASLVVQDAIEFSEDGGTLQLGDETLAYSTYDDDTSTLSLVGVTATAHDDLDAVLVLPRTEQKTAQVVIGGRGKAVTVRVQHAQYTTLAQGIKDPSRVKSVYLYWDGDEYVIEDIIGWDGDGDGDGVDPGLIAYPVVTNLYTDPKPVDFLNWVGGVGGGGGGAFNPSITADSSHADLGFHLKVTTSSIGVGEISISPNAAGIVVNHAGFPGIFALGPTVGAIPFTDNISFSFRFWSPVGGVTFTPVYSFFEADGTPVLGVDTSTCGGPETFAAGTNGTFTGFIDFDTITAGGSAIAYATACISCDGTGNSQNIFLGRAMAVYGNQQMPYRDGDSADWVWNPDGTSTGRINLDTITSWQDLGGTQPPPAAHTHVAADITDFNAAVRTNRLDQMSAPTGSVPMGTQKISALLAGAAPTDAVNKAQLDAVAAAAKTRQYMPLTTTVGGVPDLVWDANNELVLLEVPLP